MTELYFDCGMGTAGDMICAALFELCPDKEDIIEKLNSLGIPGIKYSALHAEKCGISGSHMRVEYRGAEERQESYPEHEHHHAGMRDICGIIDGLNAADSVKENAKAIYRLIAAAEAKVHGREMENIHFHELGTMDAVADVAAACYMIDALKPEHISASPIRTGFGSIKCAHGIMPVPAPATALLLQGMPVFPGDIEFEMCTPTGAAIIKHFAESFGEMPQMSIEAIGCGMGTKSFSQRPNCLRAILGESESRVIELQCNVDDMSPEAVGFALEELMNKGALDAYYEPIGMKKFRPGLLLSCICREKQRDEMVNLIFKHTSTLGIREAVCRRYVLKRRGETVTTKYGPVRVKLSEGYGIERKKAEYEDLARIARENDLSLSQLEELM